MTEAADTAPELEPARGFDSARLIADVRRGDPAAVREAYRVTFGTAMGRLVLLHALTTIGGVGAARGPETPEVANHNNGRAMALLMLAEQAGFDPVAIGAAGLTQTLEGASHERGYHHDHHRHPDAGGCAVRYDDADPDAGPDAGPGPAGGGEDGVDWGFHGGGGED